MSTGSDQPTAPPPLGRKRDATRQRLLDAANRRFRHAGYEATTAAAIADDAGVTERTFFRYFPTKADVLVANWQRHGEAFRRALTTSERADVGDVVHDALVAFTDQLQSEVDAGLDSVVRLYTDRSAFRAIIDTLLKLEEDLAVEIARRTSRHADDFDVRVAANAAFGVMRAAVRASATDPDSPPMAPMISTGLRRLAPCFETLRGSTPRRRSTTPTKTSSRAARQDR